MVSGAPIPKLLYGTAWKEERTRALTAAALDAGFVGIDTANQRKHYFEKAVGEAVQAALASGRLARAGLFLQTKFTFRAGQDQRLPYDPAAPIAEQVRQSFHRSLEHLATDYLDSFVLHGPSSRGPLTEADVEAWRAIESFAVSGQARFVGVSNVSVAQLRQLLDLSRVAPRFVQNRCYASTGWDREVRALCAERGVTYQGFSLLTANRRELSRPEVQALAARLGASVPELVFSFARELGMLPLTGTSSVEHMRLDLAAVARPLAPEHVALLETIGVTQTR